MQSHRFVEQPRQQSLANDTDLSRQHRLHPLIRTTGEIAGAAATLCIDAKLRDRPHPSWSTATSTDDRSLSP